MCPAIHLPGKPPRFDLSQALHRLPRAALLAQLTAMGLLGLLHAVVTWAPKGTFHPLVLTLFDVDREMNVPTWFSTMQWVMLAATLGATALFERTAVEGRRRSRVWALCAAGALFLSIDEASVVHERIGTILEEFLQDAAPGSRLRSILDFHSYYWIVAYLPIAIPMAAALTVFWWKQLGRARGKVFLGMFVFLYAAVGLDFIEGRFGTATHGNLTLLIASRPMPFDIFLFEELLEMFGVCLMLQGFLRHLTIVADAALGVPALPAPIAPLCRDSQELALSGEPHEIATS